MSFAPSGPTDDPEIRTASSIIDYIFHKLALTYLPFDDLLELGMASLDDMPADQTSLLEEAVKEDVHIETPVVAEASTAPEPQILATATTNEQPAKNTGSSRLDENAPLCYNCGNQTQRAGTCYVCTACGSTTGCS
jgi:ribonucleoside-diphosphate reductase alpha chain